MLVAAMRSVSALLLRGRVAEPSLQSTRSIIRIPHWEYHIRFDPRFARKRPCQDVLDRFKRLNNGMWIRAHQGRTTRRYAKNDVFQETSYLYETCTKQECEMLDRMMSPFWLRRKHYLWNAEPTLGLINDPYEAYNVRHGIDSPRVDYKGRFLRERRKVLLDDTTSDKYFNER